MKNILEEYGWLILGTLIVFYFIYKRFISSFVQDIQQRKEIERRKKFDTEIQEAYNDRIRIARERAQQELDNKVVEANKRSKIKKQDIMEKASSGTSEVSTDTDAYAFVTQLVNSAPVVVFSKTYCPYCKKAKQALSTFRMSNDLYKIIELNEREDCDKIQDALLQITGARSVPRVFIGGKCIGGCDDTMSAQRDGRLDKLLKEAGAI
uniref:Glutaredoxin domain-containing protein n=1 Tax=Onchocerca volvulus TaxID=6282 RepID=A0A2K6VXG3_ONCVO